MDETPTVVFVSFENEYAPVGGLVAVMKFLPIAVSKYCKTVLITPCFRNIDKTRHALETGLIIDSGLSARVVHLGQFNTDTSISARLDMLLI